MLRGLLIATIVAAFPLAAGAAAMSEDIPVPGGIDALAGAAGLRETPDRARFVPELTRLLFELPVRERVDSARHRNVFRRRGGGSYGQRKCRYNRGNQESAQHFRG